jgi:hypothetical protein
VDFVFRYVQANRIVHWIAIDDMADGFDEHSDHFVKCDEAFGLGDTSLQAVLKERLAEQFGSASSPAVG